MKLLSNRHTSLNKIKNSIQQPKFLHRASNQQSPQNLSSKTVTPEDALWFSRLPEKIQRGQFSLEEQILLTTRKEDVILDAADEKFYKLGEKINRSLPSLSSCYTGPSSAASFDLDDYSSVYTGDAMEAQDSVFDSFAWLDTDLDLSLDDYHVHLAQVVDPKAYPIKEEPVLRKRKSFSSSFLSKEARSASFTSRKSVEGWGAGWAPTSPVPPVPRVSSSYQTARPRATSMSSSRPKREPTAPITPEKWGSAWAPTPTVQPSVEGTVSAIDPEATHYLNPEARLKLKLYLASPSKFDEALEFGFPTLKSPTSGRPSFSSRRPSTSTARTVHHKPANIKTYKNSPTFLDDGTTTTGSVDPSVNQEVRLDLSSDLSRSSTPMACDRISSLETTIGPSMDSFEPSSLSTSHAQAQNELQSHARQLDREPYGRAWPAREMTLRMTLTRPDLRADESVLYPAQPDPAPRTNFLKRSMSVSNKLNKAGGFADNDLLKLEDLHFGDEASTVRTSKERPTGLRRFLSRK